MTDNRLLFKKYVLIYGKLERNPKTNQFFELLYVIEFFFPKITFAFVASKLSTEVRSWKI